MRRLKMKEFDQLAAFLMLSSFNPLVMLPHTELSHMRQEPSDQTKIYIKNV